MVLADEVSCFLVGRGSLGSAVWSSGVIVVVSGLRFRVLKIRGGYFGVRFVSEGLFFFVWVGVRLVGEGIVDWGVWVSLGVGSSERGLSFF